MKTSPRIAALSLSLFAAASAMAEGPLYEFPQPAPSTLTRAEVQAELTKARANGTLYRNDYEMQQFAPVTSTRTRAEVRAETIQAIASGELLALQYQSWGFDNALPSARPTTHLARAGR